MGVKNLLPQDGVAYYYPSILKLPEVDAYFERLMRNIKWKNDQLILFGKPIITARKVAWYGSEPFAYTYSHQTKKALFWTNELLELKNKIEHLTHETYNCCLLNLYHNGNEGMGWHSDNETELKPDGAIASLSLGATRKFSFRHKHTKETISVVLEHGSLLLMKGTTQTYWQHSLPRTKKVLQPRINLTL
ncbi:MAG: alpha-ketoglutarate-dependent dioxygenase AlkB [Spirosomataceae bacterium]